MYNYVVIYDNGYYEEVICVIRADSYPQAVEEAKLRGYDSEMWTSPYKVVQK